MEVLIIAKENDQLINDQIKIPEVMVIGPNGEKMGIKKIADAKTLAGYAGLDLVLMSDNASTPVCKIMDYNKFRYEKQKKVKEAQKKQREANKEIKEYRLSPDIDVHDFETRKKNAYDYLVKGHKIKASIRLKGRQMARPERAQEVLERFAESLNDVASIEQAPKMEGRSVFMLLAPKSNK